METKTLLKVSSDHLVKRMKRYLIAKSKANEQRKIDAEAFCRRWLKWTGYYLLSQKERYEMYNQFKIK